MNKAQDWMDDEVADAAGAVAFNKHRVNVSPFRLSLVDGEPSVDVSARTLGRTKVVFVRMPLQLAERLERMSRGPYTVAAAALVERGLDELERTQKKLVVDQA